jgi:histidinol-phosphatase (PHP family)
LFDIIGHTDLIKKFGHRPRVDPEPFYREAAAVFKEADAVVELNTSGRDKQAGEFYPSRAMLEALIAEGVPLTLGSDAHKPAEVGRYFDEARQLLLDLGVREIVAFERRQRRLVSL